MKKKLQKQTKSNKPIFEEAKAGDVNDFLPFLYGEYVLNRSLIKV